MSLPTLSILPRRALLAAPALLLAIELPAGAIQAHDDSAGAPAPAAADPGAAALGGLMRTAFGASVVDGEIVAGGPDWKARFPAGRVVFTPALGTRAERNLPLAFAFESVVRGADTLAAAGSAPAELAGQRISIAHAGAVERYDATADGLLLSFLIPERPGGSGDLVVRGRLETELAFAGSRAGGGLAFELPGVGGVSIGGVTAVGADGATAPGALRLDGDRLELVVPEAFVDAAAYPLVIDPEIGAVVTIDGNEWDDGDPDVAAGSDAAARYLAVWERRFSLGDIDIRGYRLDDDGDYVGTLLYLESGDETSNSPAVGFVRDSERFFVAWQEAASVFSPFQIVGRGVDAFDGDLSSKLTVAPSANQQLAPDVGGERTLADNDVMVVWGESTLGIRGRQVTLPGGGSVSTVGSALQLSDPVAGDDNTSPVITKSAGDAGRFGLAYQASGAEPYATIYYRTMSRNGTDLTGAHFLQAYLSGPHREPAMDGDGTNFMLVFERGEAYPSTLRDIWALTATATETGLSNITFQPLEQDLNDDETNPDVSFTGGQFIVSYLDVDAGSANAYTKTVDPFTCLVCEDEWLLSPSGGQDQDVKLAAHYAGGLSGDEALHVWENFEGDGDLLAQVFASPKGQVDLGGDCGAGGAASTPCPYSGHTDFAFHLGGAAPSAPAFVALAFQQQAFGCGPCTLWPSLATADVFYAGLTDAHGRASLPVALPPGSEGIVFTSQWAVTGPGASCPLFGVDVSNGVRTTIEL